MNKFENTRDMLPEPILQSFLVKTNLFINLDDVCEYFEVECHSLRSGTVVALKYKNVIKGDENLFKTKIGFKNALHLIVSYTMKKRRLKKMVQVKLTATGTFQVIGVAQQDVEKIVYKIFIRLERLNKTHRILKYNVTSTSACGVPRFEAVIVPVLNNFMVTLSTEVTNKIFCVSKVNIVQKFMDNNFLSFVVPRDPAVTIKKSFAYEEFKDHPLPYITWDKKRGRTSRYIDYESYTTLLTAVQKYNSERKKYLTFRLYSTGKMLVSGFDLIIVEKGLEEFLRVIYSL
jgi:hypothetical protein